MLYSMTGYGKAETTFQQKAISVEIRALNSKFLDLSLRVPQLYKSKDVVLRKKLKNYLHRGKIDILVSVNEASNLQSSALNKNLFKKYYFEISQICNELNLSKDNILNVIMNIPEVLIPTDEKLTEEEWTVVSALIFEAVGYFVAFRKKEGEAMETDLKERIAAISSNLEAIEEVAPKRIERIKNRINASLNDIIGIEKVDTNRFEQEVIYYVEKLDINEETVRLAAHCKHFLTELAEPVAIKGKKMGFLAQEIGREINTIGSKANDATIQTYVIKMKNELGKIKEQLMNIV
ncbi:MAG: YicC/YloC family endoribonuclease [Chitinophagales bacterium]